MNDFNDEPILILTKEEAKYILDCLPDSDDIRIKIREKSESCKL